MVERIAAWDVEALVGRDRHPVIHYGRASSRDRKVYILHSDGCRKAPHPLEDCAYSQALELGIDEWAWAGWEDQPVALGFDKDGRLVPHQMRRL